MHGRLWFLYGNDHALALEELERQIAVRQLDKSKRLALISLLTYIGAYRRCAHWLTTQDGHLHVTGQQSWYRILRAGGEPNPWRALLNEQNMEALDQTVSQMFSNLQPITVDLVGGIGDQLENAALLWASQPLLPQPTLMRLRPHGENSKVVRDFIKQVPELPLEEAAGTPGSRHVTAPWFRFWLGLRQLERPPRQLLMDPRPRPNRHSRLLTCWRCKPDLNNPLSSFSRSLPFRRIQELYSEWDGLGLVIIDISDYQLVEQQALKNLHPGVQLARENIHCLSDTRRLMAQSDWIITVDTSLVHLAVACGRKVQLLLNLFPDERWVDLLSQEGSYRQLVTAHQQQQFHNWETPLRSLRQKLEL